MCAALDTAMGVSRGYGGTLLRSLLIAQIHFDIRILLSIHVIVVDTNSVYSRVVSNGATKLTVPSVLTAKCTSGQLSGIGHCSSSSHLWL
jgi:hypothetical protein